jgi:cytochrome b pre-mRNA-processing protein 3
MFAQLVKWFQPGDSYSDLLPLYAQLVAQARQPGFYLHYGVADTVDGRFDMILLHLHLLLSAHNYDVSMKKRLMELVVADMDKSLREMGVGDMSIGKKVDKMAYAMNGRLQAYEAAGTDEAALSAALARNVYRQEEAEQAPALAEYALSAMRLLSEAEPENTVLIWPPLNA